MVTSACRRIDTVLDGMGAPLNPMGQLDGLLRTFLQAGLMTADLKRFRECDGAADGAGTARAASILKEPTSAIVLDAVESQRRPERIILEKFVRRLPFSDGRTMAQRRELRRLSGHRGTFCACAHQPRLLLLWIREASYAKVRGF